MAIERHLPSISRKAFAKTYPSDPADCRTGIDHLGKECHVSEENHLAYPMEIQTRTPGSDLEGMAP